jgi:hypothetical protein
MKRASHFISKFILIFVVLVACALASPALADIISADHDYSGPPGFDRGYQVTLYCGNSPESWLRASATLDQATGRLSVQFNLETDSTAKGPKGFIVINGYDASGKLLFTSQSDEYGIGGKAPGAARIENYGSFDNIDPNVAGKTTKLAISIHHTGSVTQIFGISGDDAQGAIKLITTVAAAAGG